MHVLLLLLTVFRVSLCLYMFPKKKKNVDANQVHIQHAGKHTTQKKNRYDPRIYCSYRSTRFLSRWLARLFCSVSPYKTNIMWPLTNANVYYQKRSVDAAASILQLQILLQPPDLACRPSLPLPLCTIILRAVYVL